MHDPPTPQKKWPVTLEKLGGTEEIPLNLDHSPTKGTNLAFLPGILLLGMSLQLSGMELLLTVGLEVTSSKTVPEA